MPSQAPEVLTRPEDLAGYEDGWRELAAAHSYFTTPDWALAWWETVAGGAGQGRVAVWRGADGTVEAVAPLLRTRHRLHPHMPLGVPCLTLLSADAGAADHLGFPAVPHRRDDVRRWLRGQAEHTSLWLPNLDETSADLLSQDAVGLARTVARWCVRKAVSALDEGSSPVDGMTVDELHEVAARLTDLRRLPEYGTLRLRQRLGPRRCGRLRPITSVVTLQYPRAWVRWHSRRLRPV